MRRRLRVQRVKKTKLISQRRQIRQQITHHLAGLPARLEIPERLRHISRRPFKGDLGDVVGLLSVLFFKRRLVVKRVHVAHRTWTINHQHLFSRHGEMPRPWRVRIVWINRRADRLFAAETGRILLSQQAGQPQPSQREAGGFHERTPVQQTAAQG